jgi:glyoxylase-like metal-dependent hydrolase (beta-lactamase superfamily II)
MRAQTGDRMKRTLRRAAVIALLVIAASLIWGYRRATDLEVAQVTDDVHVIYGLGGNVGVLSTDRGALVVDTMTFRAQGARILEAAERIGGGPVQGIVNTHYHSDHTHGNPAFPAGTRVVATEKTLAYLKQVDADYWQGDASGTLPNETFRNEHVLTIGDKTVRLIHPGPGHTDGDLVALFVEDKVIHTGDLFTNGRYPNIDLEAGGSVREWVAAIDRVLELDFDNVIPGHGPVTDREGLRAFQGFMRQLAEVGAQAARNGWSLEDTQREAVLDADAGYEVMSIPFVLKLDRAFVMRRAWEEATGKVERIALPDTK